MATKTSRYQLIKPDQDDFYNVDDFNKNADTIDTALGTHEDKSVVSEDGAHDIRFYNNKLSVRDNGVWRDAQIFATVRVAVPTGAVVKATHDNHTRVATAVDGYAYIEVNYRGVWTFVATYQTGVSETVTKDIQSNDDVDITLNFTVLSVQVREDTTTTCNGESRYSSVSTTHVFYLPSGGTYDVTMTMYGYNLKDTITVASGTTYNHAMMYTILGMTIDEESIKNDASCTYMYDAFKWFGNTAMSSAMFNLFMNRIRPFARNASGKIVPLSRSNYAVQDSSVAGYDPNYQVDITSKDEVFLFVPRMGYSHKTKNGSVGLVITDYLNDDGTQFSYAPWSLDSEGDCDGIGIACYPCDTSSPYSYSGKVIGTQSLTDQQIIDNCNARGNRFGAYTYIQHRFWMKLLMLVYKKRSLAGNPGNTNICPITTGERNTVFYMTVNREGGTGNDYGKILGLECIGGGMGTPLDGFIRVNSTTDKVRYAKHGVYETSSNIVRADRTEFGWIKYWSNKTACVSTATSSTYYMANLSNWAGTDINNRYYSTCDCNNWGMYNLATISIQRNGYYGHVARPVIYFKKGEWKLW